MAEPSKPCPCRWCTHVREVADKAAAPTPDNREEDR